MRYNPHAYQSRAVGHIIGHPYCALFLDMGLGKTVITLTALKELMNDYLESDKILVIAPLSVARNSWASEALKWDHTSDMRFSLIIGGVREREKAMASDAPVHVINRDNVVWLVSALKDRMWPYDTVVVDESSSFKNPQSKRFKALRSVRPYIRRMVLLTGTPSPNGLMDLWSQAYLLDLGKRLGRTLTSYRDRFFSPGRRNGAVVYDWRLKKGSEEMIPRLLSDICLSMKANDYLELPPSIVSPVTIGLDESEMRAYKDFEREQLMTCADGGEIEALTAAALANKLCQFSGGAVYDTEGGWHEVSRAKLDALADLVEGANGQPVLVYYAYRHELERIMATLKGYGPEEFRGEPETLKRWNKGMIRVMVCHPASVAYGLNMQSGGHIIVWYSLTWSLELYLQANARLLRQGQTKPVLIYRLSCIGTIDTRIASILEGKDDCQEALLKEIRMMREELKT
ncbi:MAG: DEAD/DEAH box helicase [Bacteroidales bacterium]